MSQGITYLHSHSGIEREKAFPKHIVLVDEEYEHIFASSAVELEKFDYNGKTYIKVPIIAFYKAGGVFKNFNS